MVSLFYIKIDDLSQIRERDSVVDSKINVIEERMIYRDNAVAIDYIIAGSPAIKKDKRPRDVIERRNKLTHILKNAVMFYIGKNREKRKKPNLSDILMAAVEKNKREMQAARRKKANFDKVDMKGNYLTENEYELIGEVIEKEIKMKMNTQHIETLQKKFDILISDLKKINIPDNLKDKPRPKPKLSASHGLLSVASNSILRKGQSYEEEKESSKL
mmetsp:Transcript_10584/g.9332  ORF Transcript_10584/g.9332 Transcript_10584/m.9332 type:complete len:216 (+) Transcript_10584:747-1394(+)